MWVWRGGFERESMSQRERKREGNRENVSETEGNRERMKEIQEDINLDVGQSELRWTLSPVA